MTSERELKQAEALATASSGQAMLDSWQTLVGDGNIEPPAAEEHGVSLHDMGAPLRAHWLGLLGFLSVILVIVFCGFMLRYGFSTSYEGRSNLLRLRYHVNRRGDQ